MRLLVACCLAILAACTSPPAAPSTPFSAALPSSMSIPDSPPPPLPATGPVGRGVLLYLGDNSATPRLVLESGEHFRLPSPPAGEGRLGTMIATLSPDGRWLGHRRAASVEDDRYVIRDLTGNQPSVEVSGHPLLWSADGRYLVISDEPTLHLVEPFSGNVHPLSPSQPFPPPLRMVHV